MLPLPLRRLTAALLLLPLAAPLAGCDGSSTPPPAVLGSLYTMTNAADGNQVVVYDRMDNGTLAERARVSAGGNGSGPGSPMPSDPLASQDALVLSPSGGFLYAVNAGSNSIAAFRVGSGGALTLVEAEPSGGAMPVGVGVSPNGQFLYVVHAMGSVGGAGAGSIAGFAIGADGGLTPLAGSARPLSGAAMTGPAVVAFSPDGARLVVTEKPTSNLVTYAIAADGTPGAPVVTAAAGVTPFGGAFTSGGTWIASNANVPAPMMPVMNGGSASSYRLNGDGTATAITASSPSYGTAACWIELTPDDQYAYTTNTASASISGYRVGSDGALTPLAGTALATLSVAGAAPLDMAVADGFLYTLSGDGAGGDGTISIHRIGSDGLLTGVSDLAAAGLPAFVTGLAAR